MAKDKSFYFPHDYDPVVDPKISALLGEHGATGYGVYWRIVEMLHTANGNVLEQKPLVFAAIARQLNASVEQIKTIVEYCINTCELFIVNGNGEICNERVFRNISRRAELSQLKSKAGKASAAKRYGKQYDGTGDEQNVTKKERKKESKENKESKERKEFIAPALSEFVDYFVQHGYKADVAHRAYRAYAENSWKDSNDKPVVNWKSKVNNVWFTPENKTPDQNAMVH